MARIIIPEDFLNQSELFQAIRQKHNADGPNSVLNAYLTEQGIDLNDGETARVAATAFEKARITKGKAAEEFRQKRDNLFDPVEKNMTSIFQFLKSLHKPHWGKVGLWGAPIQAGGKIVYPAEFLQRTAIFALMHEKYLSYPIGTSPIDAYLNEQGINLADDLLAVQQAVEADVEFDKLSKETEDATQDRNNIWDPVMKHVRGIGNFLINFYGPNTKHIGNWGFVVDDSPRKPKVVISKVLLQSSKVATNIKVGTTLKNIGTTTLNLHKGTVIGAGGIQLLPGEMYGITKGFSTITVVNPSNTTTGKFSTLRSV